MENGSSAQKKVVTLLAAYLGDPTAQNFLQYYHHEPLAVFTKKALDVLSDLIGKEKAKKELEELTA